MGYELGAVKLQRTSDGKNVLIFETFGVTKRFPKVPKNPLILIALLVTVGMLADRLFSVPPGISILLLFGSFIGWLCSQKSRSLLFPYFWLAILIVFLGALNHNLRRSSAADNGLMRLAKDGPVLIQARAVLQEEPIHIVSAKNPLTTFPPGEQSRANVNIVRLRHQGQWQKVSGYVRLSTNERLTDIHVGDEIEVTGHLSYPRSPGNPGERDAAASLRNRGLCAFLVVQHSANVRKISAAHWQFSIDRMFATVRAWGRSVIKQWLPVRQQGFALALLLGEQSALAQEDWMVYQRAGVVYLLAISGQHLTVLMGLLFLLFRLFNIPVRRRVVWLLIFCIFYAFLTGARAPVMRSAFMVGTILTGYLFRQKTMPNNLLALAWIIICFWRPQEIFQLGCQISFLATATLLHCRGYIAGLERNELDELDLQYGSPIYRFLRKTVQKLLVLQAVSLTVWAVSMPLIVQQFHLVSCVGVLITPVIMVLTACILVFGFLMYLSALVCWPLTPVFAEFTSWSISGCDSLTHWANSLPFAYFHTPGPPGWWVCGFYLVVVSFLLCPFLRRHWRWPTLLLMAWFSLGLLVDFVRVRPNEFRCTFLDVGHGSCVVMETADGRTILYDVGALSGPQVTERRIAPYLWSRGIYHIDEVFLSHADLDHFNGMIALTERFSIDQVTCTPSFRERDSVGVKRTLRALKKVGLTPRIVKAGDVLTAGDVLIQVLHPPPTGPPGVENARSLVLLITHEDRQILLTGDLADAGMQRFLARPPVLVDVLMSPHHGSLSVNTPQLAKHTQPKVVVSCQGKARGKGTAEVYRQLHIPFLSTWEHGAVTVSSRREGLFVHSYRTGKWNRLR